MSDGLKLLGSVIDNGSISVLRDLDRGLFIEGEVSLFDFLRSHYRRYGQLPAIDTVESETGIAVPEAPEVTDYYIKRVHDRRLYGVVREKFNALKETLRRFDMDEAREVIDELRASTRIHHTGTDVRTYSEALQGVMGLYTHAHINPGFSGVPSGWSMLDLSTDGYQAGDLVTFVARPSMGKCMAPETPVVKADGCVVRIDSLRAGDTLMGPDSLPRTVLSTNTGREEMFEVRPARGDTWRCNRSHILALICGKELDTTHTKGSLHFYSVDAYLALPSRVKRALRLWRTGVDMPYSAPVLDPYFVGLWLGDGTVGYARVSTIDQEIVSYLEDFAASEGMSLVQYEKREGACPQYGISGVKGADNFVLDYVRKQCYGLAGKRIPSNLLRNSREVRLSLLAGLVDSDGYRYGAGYEICTEYYELSNDLLYLARSCGFGATRKMKYVNGVEYYRVTIYGKGLSYVPCLLSRKKVTKETSREVVNSSFTLHSLGEGDYFGITLDKDHLYLLGDFTVTHNTYLLLKQALAAWKAGYNVLIVTLEMTIEQCARRMLAIETGINPIYLRKGQLSRYSQARVDHYVNNIIGSRRLHVFAGGMKSKVSDADMLVSEFKPDSLYVDGVYLMRPDSKRSMSKLERIPEVFDELKAMTLAQNIPVIATSQFSRQAGKKGKEGSLENIAYTDAISTHSSIVISIGEAPAPYEKTRKLLTFLKGREGEDGSIQLHYSFRPMCMDEIPVERDENGVPMVEVERTAVDNTNMMF